jgi:hypothetical protein
LALAEFGASQWTESDASLHASKNPANDSRDEAAVAVRGGKHAGS